MNSFVEYIFGRLLQINVCPSKVKEQKIIPNPNKNGDCRNRTGDLVHAKHTRYQLRQIPENSVTGNRTPVSRVTGGDTSHYTMTDWMLTQLLGDAKSESVYSV